MLLVKSSTVNKFLKRCPFYDRSKATIGYQLSERHTFHIRGSFLAKVPSVCVHVPQEIASPLSVVLEERKRLYSFAITCIWSWPKPWDLVNTLTLP